jgi:hypothetical protein
VEVAVVSVVIDEREQRIMDTVGSEVCALVARMLPAGRIALVPFSLVEVEQQTEDERG